MDFVSVDVETANADLASICQIGIVGFDKGQPINTWQSLINPEDHFDGVNVSIHGIDEGVVEGAPTIQDVYDDILSNLSDRIVVSHTSFDRIAITRASEKYELQAVKCEWLDSAKVVRRAWPEFSRKGYGLSNVANKLGIKFKHHDAMEDARTAGEIIVRASQVAGIEVSDWLDRVNQPIDPSCSESSNIKMKGNSDGALYKEVVVFTGALSIQRKDAAQLAAKAGCEVASSVKKNITLLIVGNQDIGRLAGHKKSAKHRRVEEMIKGG